MEFQQHPIFQKIDQNDDLEGLRKVISSMEVYLIQEISPNSDYIIFLQDGDLIQYLWLSEDRGHLIYADADDLSEEEIPEKISERIVHGHRHLKEIPFLVDYLKKSFPNRAYPPAQYEKIKMNISKLFDDKPYHKEIRTLGRFLYKHKKTEKYQSIEERLRYAIKLILEKSRIFYH